MREDEQPDQEAPEPRLSTDHAVPETPKSGVHSKPKPRSLRETGAKPGELSAAETQPKAPEVELEAQQIYDRPHQASYFVPGRVEGRSIQFLIDTGCTTNLLGKHVFDRLPERIKKERNEYAKHGLLADGTRLPFYGIIRLNMRLRQVKTEEVFIISQISEDAILGMPFLVERRCAMDFQRPVLQIDGHEIKCTDRQGRLLANSI